MKRPGEVCRDRDHAIEQQAEWLRGELRAQMERGYAPTLRFLASLEDVHAKAYERVAGELRELGWTVGITDDHVMQVHDADLLAALWPPICGPL